MVKKKPRFHACSIKQLPAKEIHAAAMFAISLNPVNRPPQRFASLGAEPDKMAIAVMTTKYFGPEGVSLSVSFLESTSAALADKILSHMNAWGQYCNATFTMHSGAASKAQVRISRGPGGYWSYLGSDVLRIPSSQPTMNLQGFSLNTPESEYRRVVEHETGHTLGCPHEHMRGEIVARLDPAKTISYFRQTQGWSTQEVQQQVLTPISEGSLMGTNHAEQDSIMCYQLPASITRDGRPIVGGTGITPSDGAFMGKVYPKAIVVPPPPASSKTRVTIEIDGKTATIVSVA